MTFEKNNKPTVYFIGVTTGQSSIMQVFPRWAAELGLNAEIKGIDLPLHAPKEQYRAVVEHIKTDSFVLGAQITSHKIDLYNAASDMFDYIGPLAKTLNEVSVLSKKDGKFLAHALDPITSGLAIEAFVPKGFFKDFGGDVMLMGAGGSSLAMCTYFANKDQTDDIPKKIIICNRSTPRLESAKLHLKPYFDRINVEFVHCPEPKDNDKVLSELMSHSLVVNATGLGKDQEGSPITKFANFPKNSLIWEINYRGNLLFMEYALEQKNSKELKVVNGWQYFIHGWSQFIAYCFHMDIKPHLDRLSEIAKQ